MSAFAPVADIADDALSGWMIWWDWGWGRKAALPATIFGVSAAIVLAGFGIHADPKALIGGTSFLAIPQLMAWMIFVGLRTGMVPQRGRRVSRSDAPVDFWITTSLYAALAIFMGGFLLKVAVDIFREG